MTVTALLNVRLAEIHARFLGQRQFQGFGVVERTPTLAMRPRGGEEPETLGLATKPPIQVPGARSAYSAATSTREKGDTVGRSARSKRDWRLARHAQMRLFTES